MVVTTWPHHRAAMLGGLRALGRQLVGLARGVGVLRDGGRQLFHGRRRVCSRLAGGLLGAGATGLVLPEVISSARLDRRGRRRTRLTTSASAFCTSPSDASTLLAGAVAAPGRGPGCQKLPAARLRARQSGRSP